MEKISEESVEQYADFFFRLTDEQLKERVAEFKKKQPNIYLRLTSDAVGLKGARKMDVVWRLNLLFTHCYESNTDKLPVITEAAFDLILKDILMKGKTWKPEFVNDTFSDMMDRGINQPHILNYMKSKIDALVIKGDTITKVEGGKILNLITLNGHLFQQAIQRYSQKN